MRRIVVTTFLTLDGVMEHPMWSMPYWNDDIAKFKGEERETCDGLLLGRITYEGFAQAWPNSKDEGADWMNNARKYVVSNTLKTATWNNSHIISGDIVAELKALKAVDGNHLLVDGSATLVQTLIAENLVDEYRLLVYPVVVGKGIRLFQDNAQATLTLVESQSFGNVLALRYHPAPKD
ncbi:MAG: dihydrofolate reductase family protein [bacterium]|nr:dihydrofolate reductase family protein [bacterium]